MIAVLDRLVGMNANERSARTRGAIIGLVVGIVLFAATGLPLLVLVAVIAGSFIGGSRAKATAQPEPVATEQR